MFCICSMFSYLYLFDGYIVYIDPFIIFFFFLFGTQNIDSLKFVWSNSRQCKLCRFFMSAQNILFTESAPRLIQSISRDVWHTICLYKLGKTSFPVNWKLLVEGHIANIGILLDVFRFLTFQ